MLHFWGGVRFGCPTPRTPQFLEPRSPLSLTRRTPAPGSGQGCGWVNRGRRIFEKNLQSGVVSCSVRLTMACLWIRFFFAPNFLFIFLGMAGVLNFQTM